MTVKIASPGARSAVERRQTATRPGLGSGIVGG
jgi:hypothetical protein